MINLPDGVWVTFQLRYRTCGHCSCMRPGGRKHGPYLDALWREPNQTKKKLRVTYVGRIDAASVPSNGYASAGMRSALRRGVEAYWSNANAEWERERKEAIA